MITNINDYDKTLKQKLGLPSDSKGVPTVVANKEFLGWRDKIDKKVLKREASNAGYNYMLGEDAELLEHARIHALVNAKPVIKDNVVGIVHPFFANLSHFEFISRCGKQDDLNEYTDRTINLLKDDKIRENANIVLFDTLYHYAAITNKLIEEGLIDDVFFTTQGQGTLLDYDKDRLRALSDKNFFMGGAYNRCCLASSIEDVYDVVDSKDQVYAIRDLCIEHPAAISYPGTLLDPAKIYKGHDKDDNEIEMDSKRVISLDDLTQRLSMKENVEVEI